MGVVRHWVGGASHLYWDTVANWSETQGGAGGASVPSAADDEAIFTSPTSLSVNIRTTVACTITLNGSTTCALIVAKNGDLTLQADLTGWYEFKLYDPVGPTAGQCNLTTNNHDISALQGILLDTLAVGYAAALGTSTLTVGGDAYDDYLTVNNGNENIDADSATFIMNPTSPHGGIVTLAAGAYGTVRINLNSSGTFGLNLNYSPTISAVDLNGDGSISPSSITCTTFDATGATSGGLTLGEAEYTWTLTVASGTISIDNCTLIGSEGTGGADFEALTTDGNVDGGSNTGWRFSPPAQDITVEETLSLTEPPISLSLVSGGVTYYDEGLEESFSSADGIQLLSTLNHELSDGLDMIDAQSIKWPITVSESLTIADLHSVLWIWVILDEMFIYDELMTGWDVTAEDNIAFTDSLAVVLGLLISDWITLIDSQSNNWNGQDIISDTLNLYDISEGAKHYADTIAESLVATDAALYSLTVIVLEHLGFTSLAAAMKSVASSVDESLSMADSAERGFALTIAEALSAVDATSVITTFLGAITDALSLADAGSAIKKVFPSVSESLIFTEAISSQGTLYNAVYDTLEMNVTVELNGEVYECYVLNTPKFMPSMYSGFNFNSYCVFENRAFGADEAIGIIELSGDTDMGATIHTGAILSETDFGAPNQKRFRRGYLGVSGSSPVMVLETEDGKRQAYTIDDKGKTVFSHEQKSKKWKLAVADFDELDSIKLIPIILSR